MKYDIVPIRSMYRGMDRVLTPEDFPILKSKQEYEVLSDKYDRYLECYLELDGSDGLKRLVEFYKEIKRYDVNLEIIVYDNFPIKDAYGYCIELLGIDIVHDMCESLISHNLNPQILCLLNENGLCEREADVDKIIPFQEHGGVMWRPCYVYKVKVLKG